jgi:hypothetical protein
MRDDKSVFFFFFFFPTQRRTLQASSLGKNYHENLLFYHTSVTVPLMTNSVTPFRLRSFSLVESFASWVYPTGNYTTVFTFHSRKKTMKKPTGPKKKKPTSDRPASNWVKFRGPLFVTLSTWRNFSGQLTWRDGGLIHFSVGYSTLMFSVASQNLAPQLRL